jgi:hypothetical protein
MMKSLRTETREVLDLSDFLFLSASKFLTIDELIKNIDHIKCTEWAKHIIAAGYTKAAPNNNPYNLWHVRD